MSKIHPLRAYREKHKLKLRDAAELFGVQPNTIWRWENGERRPDDKHLPKLAALTGASFEELISAPPVAA